MGELNDSINWKEDSIEVQIRKVAKNLSDLADIVSNLISTTDGVNSVSANLEQKANALSGMIDSLTQRIDTIEGDVGLLFSNQAEMAKDLGGSMNEVL